MFFHVLIRKTSVICKNSAFIEEVSFLNHRTHLNFVSRLNGPCCLKSSKRNLSYSKQMSSLPKPINIVKNGFHAHY